MIFNENNKLENFIHYPFHQKHTHSTKGEINQKEQKKYGQLQKKIGKNTETQKNMILTFWFMKEITFPFFT